MPRGIQTPTGFYKCVMPAYRSFVQHEHRHARRAIVQPRWGNHIAVSPITRGTRHGREPRAMECNAFGVRAIGHIVRLRNDSPSGIQTVTHPIHWYASTDHVNIKLVFTPKALHSKAQGRRASGAPWVYMPRGSKPQRGFTNAGCRVPIVRATRTSPCTSGDCPTPLG